MTETIPRTLGADRIVPWSGPIIDCDVHAAVPSLEALHPYQSPMWLQWARERGWKGPVGVADAYPPGAPTSARDEWRPPGGAVPASSLEMLQRDLLDPLRVEQAVLTCYYGVDSLRHPDWAAALASAVNDWLLDQWLEKDPRLVGSIVIPARDPVAAAKEIDRVGGDPRFRQVLVPIRSERLYGQRIFDPLYEAIVRNDLVMGLHWGGTTEGPPSTSGFASWWIEEYAAEVQSYSAQLLTMIAEGVFQRFPELRVSFLESGFTWVPSWCWRMNKEWTGLRREIPWVDEPPFDLVRRHCRFSTAPTHAGPPEEMEKMLRWIGPETLMFGSDYPHRHDDEIGDLLDLMSADQQAAVMAETAREWYRLERVNENHGPHGPEGR